VRPPANATTAHGDRPAPVLPGARGPVATPDRCRAAVDGLNFSVKRGETLSLVGESLGKTTTAGCSPVDRATDGKIIFEGRDITHQSMKQLRPLRREVQMIFQDPYSSLNPRHTVGTIVGAPFKLQAVKTENGIKKAVQDLLALVGLSPEHYKPVPARVLRRAAAAHRIARTLALRPKLIVADEPVSALDVSIQAQVINLMEDLQEEFNLTYVMIAHDLSIVRHVSDRVAVMYLGKIVEIGEASRVYTNAMHPYTTALCPRCRCRTRAGGRSGTGSG